MLILDDNSPVPSSCRGAVVAIGNFDGMHRGHQELLTTARDEAARRGSPWGLVTFEPHPRALFRPEEPMFRLTPPPMKCRLAAGMGAGFTSILTFDRALAGLEPEEFVAQKLIEQLGVAHVVTGYDFHFGKGRKGNPTTMTELGAVDGFAVTVVEQVTDDDGIAPFSSSSIRSALRHGRIADAAHQLGYWWSINGTVVEGDRRGRTIGFPTANFMLESGCEPCQGIYAVRVRDGDVLRPGAGYIGKRPTFDTDRTFLEVYLFDFDGDLYGRELSVEFIDYLRGDQKFESVEQLTIQMTEDCRVIAAKLAEMAKADPMLEFHLGSLQAAGRL
ncbi:MAG: bifunctional riboflavin kinase/FAD synthetase [Aestuariivirgaceae bacterium]